MVMNANPRWLFVPTNFRERRLSFRPTYRPPPPALCQQISPRSASVMERPLGKDSFPVGDGTFRHNIISSHTRQLQNAHSLCLRALSRTSKDLGPEVGKRRYTIQDYVPHRTPPPHSEIAYSTSHANASPLIQIKVTISGASLGEGVGTGS